MDKLFFLKYIKNGKLILGQPIIVELITWFDLVMLF